jgi:hypothetical protein
MDGSRTVLTVTGRSENKRMADLPTEVWVLLGVGGVVVAVVFAPAWVWEWAARHLARRERKSVADLHQDTAQKIRKYVRKLCKGGGGVGGI